MGQAYIFGEGRLRNLACADGHPWRSWTCPSEYRSVFRIPSTQGRAPKEVIEVPDDVDEKVARLKLNAEGIDIDTLSPEQVAYLSGEVG